MANAARLTSKELSVFSSDCTVFHENPTASGIIHLLNFIHSNMCKGISHFSDD